MASGVGSASMNAAAIGPTLAAFPGSETQIEAFAGFSNLLSFCVGIYIVIFLAMPLTEKLYDILEPKIGKASTKPINKAINNGNSMLKFANFNIDNPTKEIIKDTKISVASAFKYPPKVLYFINTY